MEIKTIRAKWMQGEDRSEVYRLLNMVHAMAGDAAINKSIRWCLSRTCSESKYTFTEWSNGIVEVGAETFKGHDGEATFHEYYLRPVSVPDELEG